MTNGFANAVKHLFITTASRADTPVIIAHTPLLFRAPSTAEASMAAMMTARMTMAAISHGVVVSISDIFESSAVKI